MSIVITTMVDVNTVMCAALSTSSLNPAFPPSLA
jgi:hypothetical protein